MKLTLFIAITFWLTSSCHSTDTAAVATIANNATGNNQLSFKINGQLWAADNEIFAVYHPKGYNKAILIAGSKGPKDKNEQAFNINLYNINGPGTYEIKNGNADNCVVQLANLSPENYLYGSMMGYYVKVTLIKCSSPATIEARFEGWLLGNNSDTLKITEGYFNYTE
jgi:hypothetical protein